MKMPKGTHVSNKRKGYSKEHSTAKISRKKVTWRSYMAFVLNLATCIDTIATASSLPIITLHSEAIPLSLVSLILYQTLFFFPNMWVTLVVDRFVGRVNAITMYATTLLATAISMLFTGNALRERSINLYLLARLINGLLRHGSSLSVLASQEVSSVSKGFNPKTLSLFSIIAAMILGGLLGDYGSDVAGIVDMLASMEFAVAALVGLLSIKWAYRPKTVPTVQRAGAYKDWLLKQRYHWIPAFLPTALSVLSVSLTQCMYPFIDRQVFHLEYTYIGIHMAVAMTVQIIIAPFIVRRVGETNKLLIYICVAFLILSTWISPWVSEKGIVFYFFMTLVFTEFPGAVLEIMFGSLAESDFKSSEKNFVTKLHRHVKQGIKQWSVVFLALIGALLGDRKDVMRLATFPLVLGLMMMILTHRLVVSLTVIILVAWTMVISPPVDDGGMWSLLI